MLISLKKRIKKIEEKKNSNKNEFVIIIDDKCTYQGKEYTEKEFYRLYPDFKNTVCIEII